MSVDAPKPAVAPQIDYADHTLEVDTRFLFANNPQLKAFIDGHRNAESSDLDETQVNELLTQGKG